MTAPGMTPLSISAWNALVSRSSRADEKPTSSGWLALGRPCANAENAIHAANADVQSTGANFIRRLHSIAAAHGTLRHSAQRRKLSDAFHPMSMTTGASACTQPAGRNGLLRKRDPLRP